MTYTLNLTAQEMKDIGFRYDVTSELYTYEFPVYKSKGKTYLWCKIGVAEDTHQIRLSVYDVNKRLYVAYYNRTFGLNRVVSIVDENIEKELKKLGAKETTNDKSRIRKSKKGK